MENQVYTFQIDLNWDLINLISQIDRFDAGWSSMEKRERQSLKQLKSIATIQSVGASTRIEGSKLSNKEVATILKEIDITKIEDRDSQEVVGYYEVLDLIYESFSDIAISESEIKNLHNVLLKYSKKDEWHRGDYKQHSNAVEARYPDGKRQIIFQTTEAGIPTQDAMRQLVAWYTSDNQTHALIKTAVFSYDFLSIHPFQDGNGRLSRLITTLLLLKQGYKWLEYVSFEQQIELRKAEYYRVLQTCQAQRPNENISEWVFFFLDSLKTLQEKLSKKLDFKESKYKLSIREKSVLTYIGNNPACKSGEIAKDLNIPSPTVKRILSKLINNNLIERHGKGPATNYSGL